MNLDKIQYFCFNMFVVPLIFPTATLTQQTKERNIMEPLSSGVLTVIAILAYVIVGLIGLSVYMSNRKRSHRRLLTASAVIACFVLVNLFTASVSSSIDENSKRPLSYAEAAKIAYGFESGKQYPLDLGARTDIFNGRVTRGFMSMSVQFQSDPAYFVTYAHDGILTPLVVPMSITTFIDTPDESPTMTLFLTDRDDSVPSLYWEADGAEYKRTWSECDYAVRNLVVACQRIGTYDAEPTVPDWPASSFDEFVGENLVSAEIRMSRAMYDQLMGKIEPQR